MTDSMSDIREITEEEFNEYGELVDGNFTVIDARWIVSINMRDDEPTLSIVDWNNGNPQPPALHLFGIDCFDGEHYKSLSVRHFVGCQATDAIWTAYLNLIAERDVAGFLAS